MDEILGHFFRNLQNNLTIWSNSNELIEDINIKTREITRAMQGMHFSIIDFRNKLSKGHITNNHPIITQVTMENNIATTSQVRVEIYHPVQSC